MYEKLIDIETAILAKEKGFDEACSYFHGTWDGYDGVHTMDNFNRHNTSKQFSAPTQTLLQQWLREKHQIDTWVEKHPDDLRYFPQCPKAKLMNGIDTFLKHEDALEAILKLALKLI